MAAIGSLTTTKDRRILCVGMCVLDIVHLCAEFPSEDTDKRCLKGYWQRGGNASNNCTVLNKLGANCELLAMKSSSPAFQFLYEDCRKRGIQFENCPTTDMEPPFSSIILSKEKGTRTIVHSNPGFPILLYEHFQKLDLTKYQWIHFEARNIEETKNMIDMIRAFNQVQTAQYNKIKISLELEKLNSELFVLAMRSDVIFIGKDIAQHMGWQSAREAVVQLNKIIMKMQNDENANEDLNLPWPKPDFICTWGSEGCVCFSSSKEEYFSVPAIKVDKIVDSLGAGDTFMAGVIFALNNLSFHLNKATNFGNSLAAFKIEHCGYDAIDNFEFNS